MKTIKLIGTLLFLSYYSIAQVITPFTVRKTVTQKGGILYLSNTASKAVPNNIVQNEMPPSGTGYDNNFTNGYVDIDNDATTWMSSSDQLNLPNCSEITWAGLYWGADCSSGDENFATRTQVKLKVNSGSYMNLTADYLKDNTVGYRTYHCFKDITSIVQNNGLTDVYTVANVAVDIGGTNLFGGWTIVVVYKNNLLTMRNLTVFDGLANVSAGTSSTVDIPISGFQTPLSGPVNFELGLVVYDGDRSLTGDQLLFKGGSTFINLSDAIHPTTDIFNSTIARSGTLTPNRNPNYNNTLGYDANIFSPNNSSKNYIGNNAISATIRQTTGGETYLTQVVTSAIDVYEPDLRSAVRVRNLNHPTSAKAYSGDTLEYIVNGLNIGSDPSINTFITDTIEGNAQFVPNSIRITYGPNIGNKTDAANDDQAEYIASTKTVRVRIGASANNFSGGLVNNSPSGTDSTQFKFKVTVSSDCVYLACDSTIDNSAFIIGTGNVSGNVFNNASNPGVFNSQGCPISGTTKSPVNTGTCTAPSASINSPICQGGNILLSVPSSSSATYYWTGPNSYTSALRNPTLTNVNAVNAGTYIANLYISGTACHFVLPVFANLVIANAGPDQTGTITCGVTTTTLAANNPPGSTGLWTILTGTGGSFGVSNASTSNVANTTFNGVPGNTYTLRWTLTSGACPSTTDDVTISFENAATAAVLTATSIPCASELAVTMSGGVGPYTLNISNGVGQINNYVSGAHFTVNPSATTSYSLISVSGSNNCSALTLSGNPTITINNAMGNGTITALNPPSGTVATTPESFPLVGTAASGNPNWSNPTNALTSNSVYASCNVGNGNQSQYLYLNNFFGSAPIPTAAVIDGIRVKLRKYATGTVTDSRVQLNYGNNSQGNSKTISGNWPTTATTYTYGTSTDLWGATLTPSVVNSPSFGIRVRVNGNSNNAIAYVDFASMIIDYHVGSNAYCDNVNNAGFSVSGYSNVTSYAWTPPTGASIVSGQGTASVVVDFNGAGQSGNYAILVTPSNGCVNGAPTTLNVPVTDCLNSSLSIMGNVYWDINGSTAPQKVDGTGIGSVNGTQLYVTLVNTSNSLFVATTSVSANGAYVFTNVLGGKNYSLTLSSVNYTSGTSPSTVLPSGCSYNGEINNNVANSLTGNDGSANGRVGVSSFNTNNETNVNFGLKILTPPVASNDGTITNEDTPVSLTVTTNDNDIDGTISVNTVTLTTTSSNGTWSAGANGVVNYTPSLNFNGLASVTYSVRDNDNLVSNAGTIQVTVTPVNDPPVGLASVVTTSQNISYTFAPSNFNYSDVENNIMSGITIASLPATGTLYYNGSAATLSLTIPSNSISALSFSPVYNQFASPYTTFTFKVNDAASGIVAGTMTVNVLHVNVAPVAVNDLFSTNQNTVVSFNVLTNDINVDGTISPASVDLDPLTAGRQTTFSVFGEGTYSVNNTGIVTFTPASNFYGNTSPILYNVANSLSLTSNNATILVTVIPYGAPVAVNDFTTTNENVPVTFNITNNDYDDGSINVSHVDFDPITPGYQQSIMVPNKGQFYVDNMGNVTFAPLWNYFGVVTTSYTVKDNLNLTSNLAQITVTVNWVNQPPMVTDDIISTNEDTPITFSAVANDYDTDGTIDLTSLDLDLNTSGRQTTYTISGQGQFSADNLGNVTFTPALNFNGTVTPKGYVIKDNLGAVSDSALINIVVIPVNDAPQAINDVAYTSAATTTGSVIFNVTSNDIDIDGNVDSTTVDLDPMTSGTQTTYSVSGEGSYTVDNIGNVTFFYTFATNTGTLTPIRYTVKDNSGATSNNATITVVVLPLGNPIAVNDTIYTNEDTPVNFDVTSNDTDDNGIDGASLVLLSPLSTASGTWAITSTTLMPGYITFSPSANFNGTVSMTYSVSDFDPLVSNTATITLNVQPVNDAPSFTKGSNQTVCENSGVQIINNWASNISTGPANESSQTVTFTVLNSNNLLFSAQPTVDASGNLSFNSANNSNGVATVSLVLQDDGGTLYGGVNSSSVQVFTITVNPTPSLTTLNSVARCNPGTVSISAIPSAGSVGWYAASLGGSALSVGNVYSPSLSVTTVFYVDVTNAGCTSTRSAVTATVNSSPSVSVSALSSSICAGSQTSLTVSGASSYTWSPVASNATVVSVSPSITTVYSVTGTDAVGCTDSKTLSLIVQANPVLTSTASSSAICINASASVNASGAQNYTWNPGALSGNAVSLSPTVTTAYTLTGIDANGCGTSSVFTLTVNALPTLTAGSTSSAICQSASVGLNVSGASTYTWMPGSLSGNSVNVSPAANTTYTVNGTDANGCVNSKTVAVIVNNNPTLTATSSSSAICANASASMTAGGAQSFTWMPGSLSGANVTVSPLSNTTYTLNGVDANGCSGSKTIALVVNANPSISASANASAICINNTNGLTANGASTYTWMPGSLNGSSVSVSPIVSTVYTVNGTNAFGCNDTKTVSITVNALPTLTTGSTSSAICQSASVGLNVSGASTYTWMPGSLSGNSVNVSPAANTTYTVNGTDANGCVNSKTVAVIVNNNPTLTATSSSSSICEAGSATLISTGATNYTWSPGPLFNDTIIVSLYQTTNFTVTGSHTTGCSSSTVLTLVVNPLPTITAVSSNSAICQTVTVNLTANGAQTYSWMPGALNGASVSVSPSVNTIYSVSATNSFGCISTRTLSQVVYALPTITAVSASSAICQNASVNITAGGAQTYTWMPGALSGSMVSVSPASSTNYTVSGTDANGCVSSASRSLVVNANPTLSAVSSSSAICFNASAVLSASGAVNYTWNPGAINTASASVSPSVNTQYTVLGTNANGCSHSLTLNLVVNANPSVSASSSSSIICKNASVSLSAIGASSYTWLPIASNGSNTADTPSASVIYTVFGSNAFGCTSSATVQQVVNVNPTVSIVSSNSAVCAGSAATITASGAQLILGCLYH